MEKEKRELKGARELRRKAEEKLKLKPVPPEKLAELKTQELIQELRVHQIELEMQNEELRRTQAVIEESRAKYSDLYDFAPVGYLILNRQGVILEVNLTACSLLGEERSLLVNVKNLFTKFIIKKVEKDLFYQHLGKVFEAKSLETCELGLKGKGDTKFYAQLQSTVVKDNLSQCRTAITDITERKQAEQIIKDTAHQFQAVVESVGEGITFSDSSGKFSVYNLKMQKLTGYTVDEANNSGDFTRLLYPEPLERQKALQRLQEIVEHKVALPLEVETTIQAKDGTKKVLWISTVEMRFKDQQMFLSIYRDITSRKQQEEAVKKVNEELQKLTQLKSDFISTVSHELRTPLSITKEGLSLVLDRIPGEINEKQFSILDTAKTNIDRLANIINELLDISKIEAGKSEMNRALADIVAMVKQIISGFAPQVKEKGLELRTDFSAAEIETYVDADKLNQIFTNLINNALKFTKTGFIEISVKDRGKEVECAVSDSGMGISPDNLPKVFGKFQQFGRVAGPGEKGTGLGLSIVKGLVEMHKGNIRVESQLEKGTKFTFILPKYNTESLFKEYINDGIRVAAKKESKISLLMVFLAGFEDMEKQIPKDELRLILKDIHDVLINALRREGDTVVKDTGEVMVLLVDCDKEGSLNVKDRLKASLNDYLKAKKLAAPLRLRFGCATYPDEAKNDEELIKKARSTDNG